MWWKILLTRLLGVGIVALALVSGYRAQLHWGWALALVAVGAELTTVGTLAWPARAPRPAPARPPDPAPSPNFLVELGELPTAGRDTRPCKKCGGETYYAVEWARNRCRTCRLYQ